MKKLRINHHIFISLMLCSLIAGSCYSHPATYGQTTVPPTTFGYLSHDPAFTQIYLFHLQPMNKRDHELFRGTWFLSDDARVTMECRIDTAGKSESFLSSQRGVHGGEEIQLTADRLKALRSALHLLPASSVSVPLSQLLLLSYRDGDITVMREYDRKHLPEQVRQVYKLACSSV